MKKSLLGALLAGGLAMVACGGRPDLYRIRFSDTSIDRSGMSVKKLPSFVLVSDTQYAVPFTDYELSYQLGAQTLKLPPELSTLQAKSFYRGAGAHLFVPIAFESVIVQQENLKREFGLFGGDMAEFACQDESRRILGMLGKHPALPFIITIGNHDAVFHGSFDTDAVGLGGTGEWDTYAWDLWNGVCSKAGKPLTKSRYIEQVLDYYKQTWKLDVAQAFMDQPELAADFTPGKPWPRGRVYAGVVHQPPAADGHRWRLEFEFQLAFEDGARSHRQSHLYQRFTRIGADDVMEVAFTSLDTTDYGSRPALCDSSGSWVDLASRFVQIGLGGAISNDQVRWLEELPPLQATPHFVLSHYLPFENVAGLNGCDTTYGTHCVGKRLADALAGATFVYGHVHQKFDEGVIQRIECSPRPCEGAGGCVRSTCNQELCKSLGETPLLRLPSLIDNKSYVVFDGKRFTQVEFVKDPHLKPKAPFFHAEYDTCQQRSYEEVELRHLLKCVTTAGARESCLNADKVEQEAKQLATKVCRDYSAAWVTENAALWKVFEDGTANDTEDPRGACKGWTVPARWRCILRGLAYTALQQANLSASDRLATAEKVLAVIEPLRKDHDPEHR